MSEEKDLKESLGKVFDAGSPQPPDHGGLEKLFYGKDLNRIKSRIPTPVHPQRNQSPFLINVYPELEGAIQEAGSSFGNIIHAYDPRALLQSLGMLASYAQSLDGTYIFNFVMAFNGSGQVEAIAGNEVIVALRWKSVDELMSKLVTFKVSPKALKWFPKPDGETSDVPTHP